jgi:hypothetical protein
MRGVHDSDVFVLQVIVLVWLLGWAIRAVLRIAGGDTRTVLLVQLIFVLFCGGPILLDLTYGAPEYSYQWGFIVSQFDRTTNLVYLGYLAVIPIILELFGGRTAAGGLREPIVLDLVRWPRVAAWAAMLALPASLLLAPRPELFLQYASALQDPTAQGNALYYIIVSLVAVLAIIAAVLVLAARSTWPIERVLAAPLLVLALWTHGKRSSVALAALLLLYLLWMRGTLRGTRFIGVALAVGLGLGAFSYLYQTRVREVGAEEQDRTRSRQSSKFYVNLRIDFGRDAVIKQAIYGELHPERLRILDYRGESLVFYGLFFVPRRLWPNKPFPYAVYATAAMMHAPVRDYRWGITTSILDEAIANFGWLGLLLGPLVPARVCAIGDRRRSPFVGLLTVTNASLLLVLHAAAFIPLILLWIGMVLTTPPVRGRAAPPATGTPGGPAGAALRLRRP